MKFSYHMIEKEKEEKQEEEKPIKLSWLQTFIAVFAGKYLKKKFPDGIMLKNVSMIEAEKRRQKINLQLYHNTQGSIQIKDTYNLKIKYNARNAEKTVNYNIRILERGKTNNENKDNKLLKVFFNGLHGDPMMPHNKPSDIENDTILIPFPGINEEFMEKYVDEILQYLDKMCEKYEYKKLDLDALSAGTKVLSILLLKLEEDKAKDPAKQKYKNINKIKYYTTVSSAPQIGKSINESFGDAAGNFIKALKKNKHKQGKIERFTNWLIKKIFGKEPSEKVKAVYDIMTEETLPTIQPNQETDTNKKHSDIHKKHSDIHKKHSDIHKKHSDIHKKHSEILKKEAINFQVIDDKFIGKENFVNKEIEKDSNNKTYFTFGEHHNAVNLSLFKTNILNIRRLLSKKNQTEEDEKLIKDLIEECQKIEPLKFVKYFPETYLNLKENKKLNNDEILSGINNYITKELSLLNFEEYKIFEKADFKSEEIKEFGEIFKNDPVTFKAILHNPRVKLLYENNNEEENLNAYLSNEFRALKTLNDQLNMLKNNIDINSKPIGKEKTFMEFMNKLNTTDLLMGTLEKQLEYEYEKDKNKITDTVLENVSKTYVDLKNKNLTDQNTKDEVRKAIKTQVEDITERKYKLNAQNMNPESYLAVCPNEINRFCKNSNISLHNLLEIGRMYKEDNQPVEDKKNQLLAMKEVADQINKTQVTQEEKLNIDELLGTLEFLVKDKVSNDKSNALLDLAKKGIDMKEFREFCDIQNNQKKQSYVEIAKKFEELNHNDIYKAMKEIKKAEAERVNHIKIKKQKTTMRKKIEAQRVRKQAQSIRRR